ncbi:C40 family peptidase [Chryseosolibacter indicus]|uniref:C40 family peptidase n=1 Tax=Chryseosolibacter indicus TaxID=2782351 RepID=A0ABS5VPY4_9BACT|nr:C40 family peptidase [Chryseosolibacter indicus]MBT1703502.1 C40 family peptidase [Chryseosolibacter indicus]
MQIIDYGVSRLSVIPVRKETADQSEQVTQLLFGDDYEVLEQTKDRKWLRIRINFDQYEGWIDARQHHSISREHFEYISRAEFKISLDLSSSLLYNKTPLPILIGSIIPITGAELFKMEEQFAFNGDSKSLGQKREFDFLRSIATKYINAPYLWGGKSPFGIDCSGFVQMVFKICGYKLLRDASQQANQGKSVKAFEEAEPGDVTFFRNNENKIVHTGIILNDHRIIHASGRVRIDQLTTEGIVNSETKAVSHQLSHIRRILAS